MSEDYLVVRPSQIQFFKTVPFYYQSKEGEFLLYKKTGEVLARERADQNRYPTLFIHNRDKEKALKELTKGLNSEFSRQLANGGLPEIKTALCALLHDVGTAKLDKSLIESKTRLTQKQFETYKTHSEMGHDMIILSSDFDVAVANVALEHHERLDKSGYPNGTNILCRESQLIGMIDSFEALTYQSKPFRKAKTPFNTLHLIKDEVIKGKFSKELFKNFTSCLTR